MGKKRIITKEGDTAATTEAAPKRTAKKQGVNGVVNITVSYNNTLVAVADLTGNVVAFSSAGLILPMSSMMAWVTGFE